jgi:pyruvate-formate lyase-activating enzyme
MGANNGQNNSGGGQLNIAAADKCNLNCVYCKSPVSGEMPSLTEICKRVKRDGITGMGIGCSGEATLNPQFPRWLEELRKAGVTRITLSTNAVALEKPELCSAVARGVDFISINIPSHLPEVYKKITGKPYLPKVRTALENLDAFGALRKTALAHIVSALNAPHLDGFAQWVAKDLRDILFVDFVFMQTCGRAEAKPQLLPDYFTVSPHITRALDTLRAASVKGVAQHMPLCALPGHENYALELQRWQDGKPALESDMPDLVPCSACKKCTLALACYGVRADYARVHGLDGFCASRKDPKKIPRLNYDRPERVR